MTLEQAAKLLQVHVFSFGEITKAYRRAAKGAHPDLRPGDADANKRMAALNEAHDILRAFVESNVTAESSNWRTGRPKSPDPDRGGQRETARRPTRTDSPPPVKRNVVWSGPPTTRSRFFDTLGFTLRPTHDRVAFRVMAGGVQHFTLERHLDDPTVLVCRDRGGAYAAIAGVSFWVDDGTLIEPREGR